MFRCCLRLGVRRRLPQSHSRGQRRARGLTLIELLIATSVLALVVGTLSALSIGVEQGYEYAEGYGTATQHARIALERIMRSAEGATTSEQFPGLIVVADYDSGSRFPETLVVWHPAGAAADSNGLPRFNELVVFCPDWYIPGNLVEITVPTDTRTVPAVTDQTTWAAEVLAIRKSAAAQKVTLTPLLRTCLVSQSPLKWRGAVRFESRLRPSDDQWARYKAGTAQWADLNWVQGIYGQKTGLRQAWLRTELQLMPGGAWSATNAAAQVAAPFFGSAAIYYEMHR